MRGLIHFLLASSFGLAGTNQKHDASATTLAAAPAPPPARDDADGGEGWDAASAWTDAEVAPAEDERPRAEDDRPAPYAPGLLQQLRARVTALLPSGLHEARAASADASGAAEAGGGARRVNRTAENDLWGHLRGNLGVEPSWYASVPQLEKTLNDATGLHDVYELGRDRTSTTTLWSLGANVWWFATVPPDQVDWAKVHYAVDDLTGNEGGGFQYPVVPSTVAPTHGHMAYNINSGGFRQKNMSMSDLLNKWGKKKPSVFSSHKGPVKPIIASHMKMGGHHRHPDDLTATDVWNQLEWLLNKTGVEMPPPRPTHPPGHATGSWDHMAQHRRHQHHLHATSRRRAEKPVHHMKQGGTKPPIPLENVVMQSIYTTPDPYMASLEGLDKVLYQLDQLLESAGGVTASSTYWRQLLAR